MTAPATRPRSLLFYAPALLDGGAERVWARLASAFAARGDAVTFAVDFVATQSAPFLSGDVALEVLPRGHFQSTRALARLLAARRPDATLSALAVTDLKHAIAATLAGRRDRAIVAYHGFSESEPQLLSRIGYRSTPLLTRLCAATVAVSAALRHDLIARYIVPERRVRTIYNPAAPAPFPERLASEALARRPKTIVALGRLVPDKDFLTLLRAFARLEDRDARLVILGEGPERPRLEAERWSLGLAGRVELPGFETDVAARLDAARVFALSSRREAFGLACVEALAHGLPVVATDCGGPAEILVAPEHGALVAVGDVEAMARALAAALSGPGDPGPRQARACAFSLDAACDRYDALISEVITHARSPAAA